MRFDLTILGCHSATPGKNRYPSAQVLQTDRHSYLIDCGEGTQIRMAEWGIRKRKIKQIFISHLHGDHVFGLAGLITTYSLAGRTAPLEIFSPEGLEEMIRVQLRNSDSFVGFKLTFNVVDTNRHYLLFEDEVLKVYTIPLKHRIATSGYLFIEQEKERKIIPEYIEKYKLSFSDIRAIKKGEDLITNNNELVLNSILTNPPSKPRSFAYCSDTIYAPDIIPYIQNVDLLYHESTYLDIDSGLATKTKHTTALQAARIAREANVENLIIGHYSARYNDISPFLSEAKSVFSNTALAKSGLSFPIKN